MAIPDYQTVMLPLLRSIADQREYGLAEVVERMSQEFSLSAEERQHLVPSGGSTVIRNRCGWARTYMKKAGLIESTRRGFFRISKQGREVLAANPARVDLKFLEQFPSFVEFKSFRRDEPERETTVSALHEQTPEEALDLAYFRLRASLEADLLDQIKKMSPSFFERLVVELLVRMGYGGTLQDAGQAVGGRATGESTGSSRETASV